MREVFRVFLVRARFLFWKHSTASDGSLQSNHPNHTGRDDKERATKPQLLVKRFMKQVLMVGLVSCLGLGLGSPLAIGAVEPVVSSVRAAQRPGQMLVDITFDLAAADGTKPRVEVEVSEDQGKTYRPLSDGLTGDFGRGIAPGANKRITWEPGVEWLGQDSAAFKFRVLPQVMVDDLDEMARSGTLPEALQLSYGKKLLEVGRTTEGATHLTRYLVGAGENTPAFADAVTNLWKCVGGGGLDASLTGSRRKNVLWEFVKLEMANEDWDRAKSDLDELTRLGEESKHLQTQRKVVEDHINGFLQVRSTASVLQTGDALLSTVIRAGFAGGRWFAIWVDGKERGVLTDFAKQWSISLCQGHHDVEVRRRTKTIATLYSSKNDTTLATGRILIEKGKTNCFEFNPSGRSVPVPVRSASSSYRPQMSNRLQMLTTRLQLTEDQQAKVKPIMDADQRVRQEFATTTRGLTPEQRRVKYFEMQDELDTKLKPILSADQYQKWLAMRPRRPASSLASPAR